MLKHITKLLYLFAFCLLISCAKSGDKLLAASDDMYYLTLYQNDKQFEILYNGFDTQQGTYIIKGDTVFLTYSFDEELPNANILLTRTLLINNATKRILAIDGKIFGAEIYIDNRKNK